MSAERRARILARFESSPGALESRRVCDVAAEVTEMTGAGVMLMTDEVHRGYVCTTNEVSARIEELQYALGEGPCIDAYHTDEPVIEPDLVHPEVARWPAFTPAAIEAGARAVFGFPLQIGAVRLGALNLYRDSPGLLTDEQHADALVMADIAAQAVLVLQAGASPGQLSPALESGGNFRIVVHQAAGMVAVQLGIDVGNALVRLRAYAFANDLPLDEVAERVVDRTLRFSDGPDLGGDS